MSEIFKLSYYALAVSLFLLAIVFLFVPLPKHEGIRNFRISLRVLSFSYLFLGAYCIIKSNYPIQLISFPFLIASIFQAHLLGMSHINMVNPKIINRSYIIRKFTPVFAFIGLYIIIRCFETHIPVYYDNLFFSLGENGQFHWEVLLRMAGLIYFVVISYQYIVQYFREERECRNRLSEYSADENLFKGIFFIHLSFWFVIGIATTAILITFCLDICFCTILNFLMLSLYIVVGILYMQYPKIFYSIYESGDVDLNHNEKTVDNAKKNEWEKWKKDILSSHIYRKEGITIYQISQELSMERKQLSYFINTKEKCNFNTFINRLRIEDAQKMVIEHPEYSFFEIALLVGYTDQANFSRKFKETTGISPSEYKKGLRTNSKE